MSRLSRLRRQQPIVPDPDHVPEPVELPLAPLEETITPPVPEPEEVGLVVMAHEHDQGAGVYRLIIGMAVDHHVAQTDEAGLPLLNDDGERVTEMERYIHPVEDYVFAADDERWQGKSGEEIAAEQRELVKAALAEREEQARAAARAPQSMPGVGDLL